MDCTIPIPIPKAANNATIPPAVRNKQFPFRALGANGEWWTNGSPSGTIRLKCGGPTTPWRAMASGGPTFLVMSCTILPKSKPHCSNQAWGEHAQCRTDAHRRDASLCHPGARQAALRRRRAHQSANCRSHRVSCDSPGAVGNCMPRPTALVAMGPALVHRGLSHVASPIPTNPSG